MALLRARVTELASENARLREAAAARDELAAAQLAARDAQIAALAAQVEELRRHLGKDYLLTEQRDIAAAQKARGPLMRATSLTGMSCSAGHGGCGRSLGATESGHSVPNRSPGFSSLPLLASATGGLQRF